MKCCFIDVRHPALGSGHWEFRFHPPACTKLFPGVYQYCFQEYTNIVPRSIPNCSQEYTNIVSRSIPILFPGVYQYCFQEYTNIVPRSIPILFPGVYQYCFQEYTNIVSRSIPILFPGNMVSLMFGSLSGSFCHSKKNRPCLTASTHVRIT